MVAMSEDRVIARGETLRCHKGAELSRAGRAKRWPGEGPPSADLRSGCGLPGWLLGVGLPTTQPAAALAGSGIHVDSKG